MGVISIDAIDGVDAGALELRLFPDPVLRERALELEGVTENVGAVAARMVEIMREHDGIGLAGPQVGLPWRIFVCCIPEGVGRRADAEPATACAGVEVFVNPRLDDFADELVVAEEGCLSLPEISGEVRRPGEARMTALGLDGVEFSRRGAGLLARCWQHEFDHLDGVLIIDRMTQLSRLKNRSAIKGLKKMAGAR